MARRAVPLDPGARSTLRSLLLPPEGYELEHVLATAYSLDLETLVTIPLFAAGLAAEEIEKPVGIARIYELGRRLTLLVQGDRINMRPRRQNSHSLVQLVADAVVPCSAGSGSFHPKLLVLKFKDIEKPKDKKRQLYRVVLATRNLTVDNSWDSVLVLDQDPDGDLVPGLSGAIMGLAQFINEKGHPAVALCEKLGRDLRNRRFQMPRGLAKLEMHLFTPGSDTAKRVQDQLLGDNLLVISPFVRQDFLRQLVEQIPGTKRNRWLVTRPVDVPKWAFDHYQILQLAEGAAPKVAPPDGEESGVQDQLRGLHAKLYLVSSKGGGETRIVITSANATPAGWRTNVEVAVSAMAEGKAYQVPALLAPSPGDAEERSFRDLLEEFTFNAVTQEAKEPLWERAARRAVAQAAVTGKAHKGPPRTLNVAMNFPCDVSLSLQGVEVDMHPFGFPNFSERMTAAPHRLTGRVEIVSGIELVPFIVLKLTKPKYKPLEIILAMQLSGDLDWGREDARRTLALGAQQWLVDELLWHFGVSSRKKGDPGHDPDPGLGPKAKRMGEHLMPILEKILLRVHGPRAQAEIETIDSLLVGVAEHEEYRPLIRMWATVKESLK